MRDKGAMMRISILLWLSLLAPAFLWGADLELTSGGVAIGSPFVSDFCYTDMRYAVWYNCCSARKGLA